MVDVVFESYKRITADNPATEQYTDTSYDSGGAVIYISLRKQKFTMKSPTEVKISLFLGRLKK